MIGLGLTALDGERVHHDDCLFCKVKVEDYVLSLPDVDGVDFDVKLEELEDGRPSFDPLTDGARLALLDIDRVNEKRDVSLSNMRALGMLVCQGKSARFSGYSVCQILEVLIMAHALLVDDKRAGLASILIGGGDEENLPEKLRRLDALMAECVKPLHDPNLLIPKGALDAFRG